MSALSLTSHHRWGANGPSKKSRTVDRVVPKKSAVVEVVEYERRARVVAVQLPKFRNQLAVSLERNLDDQLARSLELLLSAALSHAQVGNGLLRRDQLVSRLNEVTELLKAGVISDEKVVRTKCAQATIGVTSSILLKSRLESLRVGLSEAARECFELGFGRLSSRLWEEPSAVVMEDFQQAYKMFASEGNEQWSLRIPRPIYIQAVTTAKEQGLSQSSMACLCISMGLVIKGV